MAVIACKLRSRGWVGGWVGVSPADLWRNPRRPPHPRSQGATAPIHIACDVHGTSARPAWSRPSGVHARPRMCKELAEHACMLLAPGTCWATLTLAPVRRPGKEIRSPAHFMVIEHKIIPAWIGLTRIELQIFNLICWNLAKANI